jgi:hypothetical protein
MSKSGERDAPGVGPVFPEKDQAINYAQNRASFHAGEHRILTRPAMSNAAYFFSSTTTVWISAFPVFSTASNSASRHHASPAFLFIPTVFPSDPVSLPMAGVIA